MPKTHPKSSRQTKPSDGTPQLLIPSQNASSSSEFVLTFSRKLSRMQGVTVCAIFLMSRISTSGVLAQDPWLGFYASILRLIDELGQVARNAGPKDKAAARVATYVSLIWGRINAALGVQEDLATAEALLGLTPTTVMEVTAVAAEKVAETQPDSTGAVHSPGINRAPRTSRVTTTLDVLERAKKKAEKEGLQLTLAKIIEAQATAIAEMKARSKTGVSSGEQGGAK